MSGYTKLFSSITDSTIWQAPDATRLVWITMLAIADQNGYVAASVPGLAARARVSLEACVAALETFREPDEWSRTADFEGRRIADADGGWVLLNHAKYRAIREADDRREQARIAMQKLRAKRKQQPLTVNDVSHGEPRLAQAEAEAATEKERATVQQAAQGAAPMRKTANLFPQFWAAYPVKKGKAAAEKKWKARGLDAIAPEILAHIAKMQAEDDDWRRGFIPHGSTYINGERWNDEPKKPTNGVAQQSSPPKPPESFGAKAALAPSETKLERDQNYAKQRYDRGEFGDGEEGKAAYRAELAVIADKHRARQ